MVDVVAANTRDDVTLGTVVNVIHPWGVELVEADEPRVFLISNQS
jgi:hypothetical protein